MLKVTRRISTSLLAMACLFSGVGVTATPAGAGQPFGKAEEPSAALPYDPAAQRTYEAAEVSGRAHQDGVDEGEALRRLSFEDAAVGLQIEAQERWPDTFAGAWLEPDSRVVVSFTTGAEANAQKLRENFSAPDRIFSSDAALSYADLRAVQALMIEERNHVSKGEARSQASKEKGDIPPGLRRLEGKFALDIDVKNNSVVMHVAEGSAEVATEVRGRYSPRVLIRTGLPGPEQAACTRENCAFSMRGGLQFDPLCTTGFSAFGPSSGRRFALTAGHCSNTTWTHGGFAYGRTDRRDPVDDAVDAQRVVHAFNNWQHVGLIWVAAGDQRPVRFFQRHANIMIGTQVGKSGRSTDTTRGTIQTVDYSPVNGNGNGAFATTNYCSTGGDSGGPVFRNDVAWGLHSGSNSGNVPCGTAGHFAYFSVIDFVLTRLSVQLIAG